MKKMKPKRRCRWRVYKGKRIAWCRKLKKFCDAPAEYETCEEYDPRPKRQGWNKGIPRREKTKQKISASMKEAYKRGERIRKRFSPATEFKPGHIPWIKGKHHSLEAKRKMSKRARARPGPAHKFKPGHIPWQMADKWVENAIRIRMDPVSLTWYRDHPKLRIPIREYLLVHGRLSSFTEYGLLEHPVWATHTSLTLFV